MGKRAGSRMDGWIDGWMDGKQRCDIEMYTLMDGNIAFNKIKRYDQKSV